MTDKYYEIFFDPADLEVDQDGHLLNMDVLQIVEFEYDEDTDEVKACRRVDENGNVIEDRPDLYDLVHVGDGDDPTIDAAMGRFEGWLDQKLDWRESWRGDYYNPPEYICIGIQGYTDDEPRYHRLSNRWY